MKKDNKSKKETLSKIDYEFESSLIRVQIIELQKNINAKISLENKNKSKKLLIELLKKEIELLEKLEL